MNLKLKNEDKDRESEIGKWLKLFFGLPFLPSETVSDVFANVLMLEASPLPEVQRFCDYMLDTYIAPDARFQHHQMSQLFEQKWCRGFPSPHQGVSWQHLANVLLQIQEETLNVKLQSSQSVRRMTRSDCENAVLSNYDLYANDDISVLDYLRRICFKFLPIK